MTSLDSKSSIKYLITAVFFSLVSLSFHTNVSADNLQSPTYEIQMSTINITGGYKSSSSYQLTDTVGQSFQGQFNSTGYVILAGFQYIHTLMPFSFSISDLDLNFGSLTPNTPQTQNTILTVTTGSAYGYTVTALADHSLKGTSNPVTIPDTACDLATPCLPTSANIWTENDRYGLGYNVQGADAAADFQNSTYFRPLALENIDPPAVIMSKNGIATASASTVTLKLNISDTQAAGTYQNSIQFIAIPSF